MAKFLIFTKIKPTTKFFGCLPLRIGIGVCFVFLFGILLGDIFEHIRLFKNQPGIINQWITCIIQIFFCMAMFVNMMLKNKGIAMVVYFLMIFDFITTLIEKLPKAIYIGTLKLKIIFEKNIDENLEEGSKNKFLTLKTGDLVVIYLCRIFAEFVVLFYISYICYSYAEQIAEEHCIKNNLVSKKKAKTKSKARARAKTDIKQVKSK